MPSTDATAAPVVDRVVADSTYAIETRSLTKVFGSQRAVDGIDLLVPRGSVYGFLGPNGSGKTTTIRMLMGLVNPTSGERRILGRPLPDGLLPALQRVGSLIEGPAFHPYLSGRANLQRLDAADSHADASTCGRRIDAALDRVGLTPAAAKKFRTYSLGMKQRLAIAAALLAPRDLLVLDEPTNGLDPQGTREVRHLVAGLATEGITVLISSHLLSEIEQICSHIGVMRAGTLVAQGAIDELRTSQTTGLSLTTPDADTALKVLQREGVSDLDVTGPQVTGRPGELHPEDLVSALVAAQVRVQAFAFERPSLEDYYVSLTGEGFAVRS